VDVGGGSVEFIVADAQKPLLLESRKLGSARMTARYVKSDPVSPHDIKALLRHYDEELGPICQSIAALRPARAIGTSGTLENLAEMCGTAHDSENGHDGHPVNRSGIAGWIERDALSRLVSRLLESRSKDR